MKIYIAAPYTKGDVVLNIRRVIQAADALVAMGHTPLIPHLTHFWHLISPKSHEFWLSYDLELLDFCDALLRLDGESAGADKEVEYAEQHCIMVFHSVEELVGRL